MWWILTVQDFVYTFPGTDERLINEQTEKINGTKRLKSIIKAIARNTERLKDQYSTKIIIENCITGLKKECDLYANYEKIINHKNLIEYINNNE